MKPEHKSISAEIKADETGRITGIAWVWGYPDSVGDVIEKSAFANLSAELPMLLGHDTSAVIGVWDKVEITDKGLEVSGQLDGSTKARAVRLMLKSGLVSGLSISFIARETKQAGKNRVITSLDLLEISVVGRPANRRARVTNIKTFDASAHSAMTDAINQTAIALRNQGK